MARFLPGCRKNRIFEIVGGDAHIAPQKICRINNAFRQIRYILHRADVGIGPYDNLLRQSHRKRATARFLLFLCTAKAKTVCEFFVDKP